LTFVSNPGRCYGFFGRNGAGKTTTIKCLLAAPAALSLIMLIPLLGDVVRWAARHVGIRPSTYLFGLEPTSVIAFIVFSFLIAFGLPNYRTSDRSSIRIWRQLLWLCGSVICIMFVALIARSALGLAIIRD